MEVTVTAVIVGLAFGLPLTVDEQNVFGNVLLAAGYVILIIAAQRTLITNAETAAQAAASTQSMQAQIDDLQRQLAAMPEVPEAVN
ncbi:MAG TPA: hypothetical protein PKA28_19480 [Methylomusa anaerophila]|nr:hypothetical protein [Methylomusa anaerophila]